MTERTPVPTEPRSEPSSPVPPGPTGFQPSALPPAGEDHLPPAEPPPRREGVVSDPDIVPPGNLP
jgi:hypothetical protein